MTPPLRPPAGVLQAIYILLVGLLKGPGHSRLLWVLDPLKASEFVFMLDESNAAILGIRELTHMGSREGPAISQRVNRVRISAAAKSHHGCCLSGVCGVNSADGEMAELGLESRSLVEEEPHPGFRLSPHCPPSPGAPGPPIARLRVLDSEAEPPQPARGSDTSCPG